MSKKKSKRFADAASIIGDDLAEELETKSQELIGRSGPGIDPMAVVLKDAEDFPPSEEEEGEATGTVSDQEEGTGEAPFGQRSYGGAMTLDEAESFLVRENGPDFLNGDWGVLSGVLTNIAGVEKGPTIQRELKEFQRRIDVLTVKAIQNISLQSKEAEMPDEKETQAAEGQVAESENEAEAEQAVVERSENEGETNAEAQAETAVGDHPLDEAYLKLRESFDEAVATPLDAQSRLKMVQPALNALGEAIIGRASETGAGAIAGPNIAEEVTKAVQAAVAPLAAELAQLRQAAAVERDANAIPERRSVRSVFNSRTSYQGAVPGATARMPDEIAAAQSMRGVGSDFHQPPTINNGNGAVQGSETPNLRSMIRRSVGIRE